MVSIATTDTPRTDTAFDGRRRAGTMAFAVVGIALTAVILATPWLVQELVPCEWIGLAIPLLIIRRLKGWWGETTVLATALVALGIAFHWTPQVLASSLNAPLPVAFTVTAPIIFLDAIRLAAPFLFAARVGVSPLVAWLPAGLAAVVVEAIMPTVFPWKHGYAQIHWYPLVQSADLFGPETTTLVAFAHAGVVVGIAHASGLVRGFGDLRRRPERLAVIAAVVLVAANALYGFAAVRFWSARIAAAPTIGVLAVQANPEEGDGVEALQTLTSEACAADPAGVELVCWPECSGGSYSAKLDSLADPEQVLEMSRDPRRGFQPMPSLDCPLLFGGKCWVGHRDKPRAVHQAAILLDAAERIAGRYHKRHLMPFGEYVPGSEWSLEVARMFPMHEPLEEGTEATVLAGDGPARLGVLLCYEDMIPSAARSLAAESANVFVSLINGAAFTAPLTLRQHRLLAQMRAVESRRFLVRCAATGETCVISPLGTVVDRLPLQARGYLKARVPLLEGRTLFTCVGNALLPSVCALGMVPFGVAGYRRRRAARGPTPAAAL